MLYNVLEVDNRDPDGCTLLWHASSHGHTSIARMLIERGADVNACSCDGISCISAAVSGGHVDVVRLLLDNGVDVNKVGGGGLTLLQIAIEIGSTILLGLLLEHGARINRENSKKDYSLLYWSACRGQTVIVNWLLDRGADVNECDSQGCSCLLAATYAGHRDTVMALLQKGVSLSQARDDGQSPLIVAARDNHIDLVKVLLDHGALIDARDGRMWTALYWAARKGHNQLVRLLIDFGADVNASSISGHTCLMAAVYNKHPDIVLEFIRKQANVNKQRHDGAAAMHIACEVGHTEIVGMLLDGGARIDVKDSKGWMPLQRASYAGRVEVFRKLIARARDSSILCTLMLLEHRVIHQGISASALDIACFYGHMDIVELIQDVLLELQGEIRDNQSLGTVCLFDDGTDNCCNTPLHLCCNVQQAMSLLEGGADLEAENIDGLRPIHFAVRTGVEELVCLLISYGANLDATDIHGNTPLHEAVLRSLSVVELLVRNGARTCVRNNDGKSPYHVAAYFHKTDVVQFLQNCDTPERIELFADKSRHSKLHHFVAADLGQNCTFRMSKNVNDAIGSLLYTVDIDGQNCCGHTPLHVARGKRAIEALIQTENADILTTKDTTGRNYFHLICASQNTRSDVEIEEIFRSFAETKMKIKAGFHTADKLRRTPLHYAAMTEAQLPFFKYILSIAPESISKQDVFGRTPLHYDRIAGKSEILMRFASSDEKEIRDQFCMTEGDYGNCRHASKIWEMFREIYPGKEITLVSPEFVKENLSCLSENSSLCNAIRSIRGQKDVSSYISSILDATQYRYVSSDGRSVTKETYSYITAVVDKAMRRLADKISKIEGRLACSVLAVGSAFERTKVGLCDEFDYMFVLTEFSKEVRAKASPELPNEFVQLEPRDIDSGVWNRLLTADGLVNTQAVRLLFETVVEQILADCWFQTQNDLEVLNPVGYFDHINEHISKKSNMKIDLRLSKPVNGVHVIHDISVDIVPAICVVSLPDGVRQSVEECLREAKCHLVLVQPSWVYPWMPWSQTSAMVSFTRAESLLIRHGPPVVRDAYMVVKHMAKYFSNDVWLTSHVIKTAVLLIMEEEGLIAKPSATPIAIDKNHVHSERKSVIEDDGCEEMVRWVRKVTSRLLCFAAQDMVPSFSIRSCPLAVWHNFEPYPKFSHTCLHRHRLSYVDLLSDTFCRDVESGRVRDFQLVNIQRAFVCTHLMHWSVLADDQKPELHLPHSIDCMKTAFTCCN